MIEISGIAFHHVSVRNAIAYADYIVQKNGKEALANLFANILKKDTLISTRYCYHGKPLDLPFFQNIENWYSNEISMQMFDNLKNMDLDLFEVGYHSVLQAAKTQNFAVMGMMKALGPKNMAKRISSINSLYNKTKTASAEIIKDNYIVVSIKYHRGIAHTAEITRQNIGAYAAGASLVGKRNIEYEILSDDFSTDNGHTQFKISWNSAPAWLRLRWFFGRHIACFMATTYLRSHRVVEDFHSELVVSLQEEIAKKEKASKKNDIYYQALLNARQQQTEVLEAEVERKTIGLRKALEDKQQLFSDFSHEVRTPLMLAMNPIKRVQSFIKDPKCQSLLVTAQTNLEDLELMFKQLYRLESVELQGSAVITIDLSNIVNRVVESIRYLAKDLSIEISIKIPANLIVKVQVGSVELILKNLIENALKYCRIGDRICISANIQKNKTILLVVEDTGPGIPISHREKIFQRFHRVPGVENIRGAGIGLAIVKQWVEANDGDIYCMPSKAGGARFEINLPLVKSVSNHQSQEPQSNELPLNMGRVPSPVNVSQNKTLVEFNNTQKTNIEDKHLAKPTILVVEDNRQLREYMSEFLSRNFNCMQADNGEAGWQIILSQAPDVVVSDVMMPKLDGYQLTKRIKTNLMSCHIPVLLLTAKGDTESQLTGLKVEADDYLAKPIDDDVLLQKIVNILSQQHRLTVHIKKEMILGNHRGEYLNTVQDTWKIQLDNYLDKHFSDENLTIGDLAKELAMSERKMQMVFKKSIGMTPIQYKKIFRLNKAKEMIIQNPNESLTHIAMNCGFNCLQSFSKAYKIQYGVMASTMRNS